MAVHDEAAHSYTADMTPGRRTLVLAAAICALIFAQARDPKPNAMKRWYKGNLHTHTLNSDGDSTPDEVTTWYREHGYNFLVQNNVNEIRRAKGIPSVNHPNFHWAITIRDLLAVKGLGLFEVYNGHPMVNNDGGGGFASLDEMWDALLSAGQRLYGIAVDDAHHFKKFGKEYSNPGHGWIHVSADSLTPDAILTAIEAGDFYATSGVTLRDVAVTRSEYRVEVARAANWEEKITTYFIGR
jgi:hypothetical protein